MHIKFLHIKKIIIIFYVYFFKDKYFDPKYLVFNIYEILLKYYYLIILYCYKK